ncbi:hypothetical protein GCM10011507_08270 [Edaphobacter acidisoli]|uniref:Uncharacterized protein n=1 Tax=Edaphobacter acidisoli TaxID=2040573 RepID=A0A916W1K2_9BACT|nr:hypothetical protein [Edaphobacter acidisoli]GGA59232.1 hypothetical protein GCM10011507_08270 [Edaphobacter acidisoli]
MSNELPTVAGATQEKHAAHETPHAHYHRSPQARTDPAHIEELERENTRLQLLVAELLIKNQQLRKAEPD